MLTIYQSFGIFSFKSPIGGQRSSNQTLGSDFIVNTITVMSRLHMQVFEISATLLSLLVILSHSFRSFGTGKGQVWTYLIIKVSCILTVSEALQ